MALIGEQFGEMEERCGVVARIRQRGDKISLWTKNATNEAVQMSIGRKWKEVIDVDDNINYSFHDDSRRDRSLKGRYSIQTAACNSGKVKPNHARKPSLSPFFLASRMSPCLCFASAPIDLQNSVMT